MRLFRPIFIVVFILIAIVLMVLSFILFPKHPAHFIVDLRNDGFYPKVLTIHQGDTITFTTSVSRPFWPASDLHPTHGIYPEFDPQKPILATESWSFTFDRKGRFKFHDHLAPMTRGIVTVQ